MHADFVFALEEKVLIMTVRNRTPLTYDSCMGAYKAELATQIGSHWLHRAELRTALCATGCACELTICLTCAPQPAHLLMQARTPLKA